MKGTRLLVLMVFLALAACNDEANVEQKADSVEKKTDSVGKKADSTLKAGYDLVEEKPRAIRQGIENQIKSRNLD